MQRGFRGRVVGLSTAVGSVPSVMYLTLYVACIPIFAKVYQTLPYSFYHATVRFEASYRSDQERVRRVIARSIVNGLKKHYGDEIAITPTVSLDSVKPVLVGYPSIEGSAWKVGVAMFFIGAPKFVNASLTLSFDLSPFFVQGSHSFQHLVVHLADPVISPLPRDSLFPHHPEYSDRIAFGLMGNSGFLLVSNADLDTLRYFENASYGFPSASSGSFRRMLYLSAVTITTLGYGDVVPITDAARLLVALEAVLGVVLAGLFLNSLAHEIANGAVAGRDNASV